MPDVTRPNVLFVLCDDLNCAVEGFGGHPQTRTPNVSRLAERSVAFDNAHCNSPICAPSRASMWSGFQPHTSGDYDFSHWQSYPLLAESVMLQEQFATEGYDVYGTGKLMHNGQEDYGMYDAFGWEASFGPFPWDGETDDWRPHPKMADLFDGREGFRAPWEQTFGRLSEVPEWGEGGEATGDDGGWRLYGEPFRYEGPDDRDLLPDERSAEWAADRLRRDHDDPFFMAVGFNRPHTPLYAPDEHFDRFPVADLNLPGEQSFPDDVPAIAEDLYSYGVDRFDLLDEAGGERLRREWLQAYLACVNFVDDQVGTLLDALESGPNAEDTVVVFTSDNGYHMGEKGMLFKKTLYDEATRVPLLISTPETREHGGRRCSRPVSLVDLYPTLLDCCGLPAEPNAGGTGYALDGTSLRPLLSAPGAEWDGADVALSAIEPAGLEVEHGWLSPVEALGEAQFSVRGERYRYSRFGDGSEQLFDHEHDPRERENLAEDEPGAVQRAHRRRLVGVLQGRETPATDSGIE